MVECGILQCYQHNILSSCGLVTNLKGEAQGRAAFGVFVYHCLHLTQCVFPLQQMYHQTSACRPVQSKCNSSKPQFTSVQLKRY